MQLPAKGGWELCSTWLGSLEGEKRSSAWRERLYRMSKGRALTLLTVLFKALHADETWSARNAGLRMPQDHESMQESEMDWICQICSATDA